MRDSFRVVCLVICFVFFNSIHLLHGTELRRSVVAAERNELFSQSLCEVCPESVLIERLTFDSDVYFQKEEFLYLVGFNEGDLIDSPDLINAVNYLSKKNKFNRIKIEVVSGSQGKWFHFDFEGLWTFKKLKIGGVFQGRDVFKHFYLMEQGEAFDRAKHEHSIIKIKEALQQKGYCASGVTTDFDYDQEKKEITVYININKGKRFTIGSLSVEMSAEDVQELPNDFERIIYKRLSRKLVSLQFVQELINQEALALKRFLARKGFLQVIIELEQYPDNTLGVVHLNWRITLSQKREFIFFGNRFFSRKQLLDKIFAFGRSSWLLPSSILAEEIARAYKDKGFWRATVTTQEEKERSFFVIAEGEQAVIARVEINAVDKKALHFDQHYLKKRCFGKVLKRKYYDAGMYEESVGLLTSLYHQEGFLSCCVINHSFKSLSCDNEYELIVTIDQGERSYISSLSIENYPQLEQQGPFKNFFSKEKIVPFDAGVLEEQRAWLTAHFRQCGYLHPSVRPIIEAHEHDVKVQWIVEPGEQIRFGKTVVIGSLSLPFFRLFNAVHYQQGQLWSQEKMKQTFLSLKEMEIFDSIHLLPDYCQEGEEKPIILKIKEDDRFEVRARTGLELQHVRKYQTFGGLTYKLGGTGIVKNPFNRGDQIRIDLDFTRSHREVVGFYRFPLRSFSPFNTTFQVHSVSHDHPGFISSSKDLYTLVTHGFLTCIAGKTERIDVSLNAGFELMKTKIKDTSFAVRLARAINFEPLLVDKLVPFFLIEPTIIIERLDDALLPRRGTLTLFSLKGMIPIKQKYKDSLFFKFLVEQSFFAPLKSVVIALRLRFGHIFHRELKAIMPSERFYLGGSHSLRGYEADFAPPLGIFINDDDEELLVPRGGRSMANANIEARIPLFKKVGGVIFQDFGALSSDMFADFKPKNVLAATGFGVRFFTPLGPLRFDIGWKWRRQSELERRFAWFLTFGQAF